MPLPDKIEIWVLELAQLDANVNGAWKVVYIGDKFFCEKDAKRREKDDGLFPGESRVRQVAYNSAINPRK